MCVCGGGAPSELCEFTGEFTPLCTRDLYWPHLALHLWSRVFSQIRPLHNSCLGCTDSKATPRWLTCLCTCRAVTVLEGRSCKYQAHRGTSEFLGSPVEATYRPQLRTIKLQDFESLRLGLLTLRTSQPEFATHCLNIWPHPLALKTFLTQRQGLATLSPQDLHSSWSQAPRAASLQQYSLARWHLTTAPWITEENKIGFSSTTNLSEKFCLSKTSKFALTGLFWELLLIFHLAYIWRKFLFLLALSEALMRPCSAYFSLSPPAFPPGPL